MRILHAVVQQNHALSVTGGAQANPGMFNEVLRHCDRLAKHDCLICVISDAYGHDEESRQLLTRIAWHNDVLFAFIHDPLRWNCLPPGRWCSAMAASNWRWTPATAAFANASALHSPRNAPPDENFSCNG